jgi:MFS transporter, DHA1 family, multidrug resistance protein
MGGATCFVYVFATLAPFIAIDILHMSSSMYGVANLLPPVGLVLGSLFSARLANQYQQTFIIYLGILIALCGSTIMLIFVFLQMSALLILFIPMMLCYFGLSLVFANASTVAMSHVIDKANGSAVMNFTNMGFVTIVVLTLSLLHTRLLLMPITYILICACMFVLYKFLIRGGNEKR